MTYALVVRNLHYILFRHNKGQCILFNFPQVLQLIIIAGGVLCSAVSILLCALLVRIYSQYMYTDMLVIAVPIFLPSPLNPPPPPGTHMQSVLISEPILFLTTPYLTLCNLCQAFSFPTLYPSFFLLLNHSPAFTVYTYPVAT